MRVKTAFIFLSSILIPTFFLAYFGFLAVRSESSIVERHMSERYEAIASIVAGEIKRGLTEMPEEDRHRAQAIETMIVNRASLFRDQVAFFDPEGKPIGEGPGTKLREAVFAQMLEGLPYTLAIYERHPFLFAKAQQKKRGILLYTLAIGLSSLAIIVGGVFTLGMLGREWRLANLKSDFVLQLSHDLIRPLTSIQMFSEMLMGDRVESDEKRREYYRIIAAETERLTQLAYNILDFSRIERGSKKCHFETVNLAKLTRETVERFKTYLEDGQPISTEIDDPFPLVRVDADSIAQVLINLLSNAAKYSPRNAEIKVRLTRKNGAALLEVVDQGIGIPKAEQGKIFDKFYRVAQKDGSKVEGSGLGLTLVKYAVKAHRGRIQVESKENQGSKFSIRLPV